MCTQYQLTIVFKTEFGGADILGLRRGYVNKRSESWEVVCSLAINPLFDTFIVKKKFCFEKQGKTLA